MSKCFSCLLPPLMSVIATLCPNSEQHHPSHLYLPFPYAKTPISSCHCVLSSTYGPPSQNFITTMFSSTTLLSSSNVIRPFSSVPYPIHPITQSSPDNCFLYPGFVSHSLSFTSSTKLTHYCQAFPITMPILEISTPNQASSRWPPITTAQRCLE